MCSLIDLSILSYLSTARGDGDGDGLSLAGEGGGDQRSGDQSVTHFVRGFGKIEISCIKRGVDDEKKLKTREE